MALVATFVVVVLFVRVVLTMTLMVTPVLCVLAPVVSVVVVPGAAVEDLGNSH